MTSPVLLFMVAMVFVTMFGGLPSYFFRHRYETRLMTKMSNDENLAYSDCPSKFKSLYITNLDAEVTEEMLILMFSDFGKVITSNLAKDFRGESRGFAFLEFENADSARQAEIHMNGRLLGQKILYVERTPKVEEGRDI